MNVGVDRGRAAAASRATAVAGRRPATVGAEPRRAVPSGAASGRAARRSGSRCLRALGRRLVSAHRPRWLRLHELPRRDTVPVLPAAAGSAARRGGARAVAARGRRRAEPPRVPARAVGRLRHHARARHAARGHPRELVARTLPGLGAAHAALSLHDLPRLLGLGVPRARARARRRRGDAAGGRRAGAPERRGARDQLRRRTLRASRSWQRPLRVVLPAAIGVALWMAWLWSQTGDALAFVHAKAAWREVTLASLLAGADTVPKADLAPLALAAVVLALAWRRLPVEWLLFAALALLPSLGLGILGMPRYAAACFPVSVAAGIVLARLPRSGRVAALGCAARGAVPGRATDPARWSRCRERHTRISRAAPRASPARAASSPAGSASSARTSRSRSPRPAHGCA